MPRASTPRVLFISNGHGEDNHASYIVRALRGAAPDIEISALPIVGLGGAYRALDVPIVGPTMDLPSGGFTYHNRLRLLGDVRAGLVGLAIGQFRAARREGRVHDLVVAVGDVVAAGFARATGLPFIQFISSLSALYEGTLKLDASLSRAVRSPRCKALYTRDRATAEDLRRQGYTGVHLAGIPSLDWVRAAGRELSLDPGRPMVALLPGSRIPEAARNFALMLRMLEIDATLPGPAPQYRAALVPRLLAGLDKVAADAGWQRDGTWLRGPGGARVMCHDDAFNDIVARADCVIGMAGLAVDQAVGIGKPVIMIPGRGPQFTHAFAEAQERLLGAGAVVIGTGPATVQDLERTSERLRAVLSDDDYRDLADRTGRERLGALGGAQRIAARVLGLLEQGPDPTAEAAMTSA